MSVATRVASAAPATGGGITDAHLTSQGCKQNARGTQGLLPAKPPAPRPPRLPVTTSGRADSFAVGGHRGNGENLLPSDHLPQLRENTIASFQRAVQGGAAFLEFDVQVTRDGVPVVWHDNWIQTVAADGTLQRQLVRDTTLAQFKALVPQQQQQPAASPALMRNFKTTSGAFLATAASWRAVQEDQLPTLAEVFAAIPRHVGFDMEIKTTTPSDWQRTPASEVARLVEAVTGAVATLTSGSARPIAFSSFDPEVCQALHARQSAVPVLLLSHAGEGYHCDPRRTSLPAAIALARDTGLQGLVVDSSALRRQQSGVQAALAQGLSVLTYGLANNDPQWVAEQRAWGVQAAICDNVAAVAAAVVAAGATALASG